MGANTLTLGNGEVVTLAGRGERAKARMVDLFLLIWPLLYAGAASLAARITTCLFGECSTSGLSDHYFFRSASIVWLAVVLYEPVAMAIWGRTLGKLLMGIRVVNVNTGRPLGLRRTLVRFACTSWLGSLLFLTESTNLSTNLWPSNSGADVFGGTKIGWASGYAYMAGLVWWLTVHLSMLWYADDRGWHDRLGESAVIKTSHYR